MQQGKLFPVGAGLVASSAPCGKHFFTREALSQRICSSSISLSASNFAKSSFRSSTFFCLKADKAKAMHEIPSLCVLKARVGPKQESDRLNQTKSPHLGVLSSVSSWRWMVRGQVAYGNLNYIIISLINTHFYWAWCVWLQVHMKYISLFLGEAGKPS